MNVSLGKSLYVACVVMSGVSLCLSVLAFGQASGPQARVKESIRNDQVVMLPGNLHPMARPGNDRGILPETQPVTRMHLLLQRSAEQEGALQMLLAQQQDSSSPKFHAWLTPQEFGQQYGPADSDVQSVKDWLSLQGFSNLKVNNGKTVIEFSGTAGQVRNAFHTEIHRLSVGGEEHFANMQEPRIPAALAPVVAGVVGLHNFHPKPLLKRFGKFQRNMKTGEITPLFTFNDVNGTFFGIGPADFKTIYNVPATFDGTGVSIAIVAQSNINLQDVADFRSIFGLSANSPTVVLNGADPGLVSGDEAESDLDVEWAGAVAPKATIKLVTTGHTDTDGLGGVDLSALYIVDNNVAAVMSDSYGACESALGTSGNAFYNSLWQQAAAEGITVSVSAGDNGSAGCDDPNSQTSATHGIAVSGIASTPFNVAMGGTDFDQANIQSTFWNSTNGGSTQVSAKGYIPEIAWNDSCANAGLTGCNTVTSTSASLTAGSGGPSSVYTKTQAPWQTGFGDTKRDLPDVSLFSSDGQNKSFYIVCQSDQDIAGDTGCNLTTFSNNSPFHDFQAIGGTSAAAPTFAGIMALVNQRTGQRQGNANVTLYSLAKSEAFSSCNSTNGTSGSASNTTCVFNDITKGNISVPCTGASPNCSKTSSGGFGVIASGGAPAFAAAQGYDLATGLGSLNVANLINKWATPTLIGTSITLSPATITGTVGSAVTLSGKVTKSSGSAALSGTVVFENTATGFPADSATPDSSGNYNVSTTFLPAGAYSLTAHYGGDPTYAPSDSTAISVNLAKQNSTVLISFVNAAGSLVTGNQSVAYGSHYILRVDVENAAGVMCQTISSGTINFICPTGSVSLLDGGQPLKDFSNAQTPNASNTSRLNDRGFTEDKPIQLNVGSHTITATYAADATSSYNSNASSNSLSIMITQAATTTAAVPSTTSITSGGSVGFTATVSSSSNSAQGPTGTVQFLNGGANFGAAVTCKPASATSTTGASCTATLPPTALSALPPGIIDLRPPKTPFVILAVLGVALAMLSFLLAAVTARSRQYAYVGLAFFLVAAAALAGCSGGSSSSSSGGGMARSITAKYSGDTNYAGSTSSAVTITIH